MVENEENFGVNGDGVSKKICGIQKKTNKTQEFIFMQEFNVISTK